MPVRAPRRPAAVSAPPSLLALLLLTSTAALAGCRPERARAETADGEPLARPVGAIAGFHGPESVRYDEEADLFYVSNMYLWGSWKDNNGFIARVSAADPRRGDVLVQGGVNGVTLHAPKGMALIGDTLWVADIDVLRGFHRRTGAPLAEIDFRPHGATLLNDVAVGPDGTLRVTDTGIVMSYVGTVYDTTGDRVFRVGPGRAVTALPAGEPFPKPNGITWDPTRQRWLVVTFGQFASTLYALDEGAGTRTPLATGRGQWDGVEVLRDGRVLVTSWKDSSLRLIDGERNEAIVRHLWQPADLGVDTRRNRVAIPVAGTNRVELWSIPGRRAEGGGRRGTRD